MLQHYNKIFFLYGFITEHQTNTIKIEFKSNAFYIDAHVISDSEIVDGFLGNISLNGQTYKDVTKVLKDYKDNTSYLFINKYEGIIRININNSEVWTILK